MLVSEQLDTYEAVCDFRKTALKVHVLKNIEVLYWLRKDDDEDA